MADYKLMLRAAIEAQLISLRARKTIARRWDDRDNHCRFELDMLSNQISALEHALNELTREA